LAAFWLDKIITEPNENLHKSLSNNLFGKFFSVSRSKWLLFNTVLLLAYTYLSIQNQVFSNLLKLSLSAVSGNDCPVVPSNPPQIHAGPVEVDYKDAALCFIPTQ
jgi:hypothetical protein